DTIWRLAVGRAGACPRKRSSPFRPARKRENREARMNQPQLSEVPTHLVYMTAPSREEAMKIAGTVVQEKLAACANILSHVTSIYEWQGKMQTEEECVVILKTQEARVSWLTDRLVQ